MKTKLTTLFISLIISATAFAAPVTQPQALKVTQQVLNEQSGLRSSQDISLVYTQQASSLLRSSGEILYYVYNVGPEGFVIVAGDDLIYPVIGYSFNGHFDVENVPSNFRFYLDALEEVIQLRIDNQITPSPQTKEAWNSYLTGSSTGLRAAQAVGPLINTEWGQSTPYNLQCPTKSGQNTLTGCGATSMAQIMKFWSYPAKGAGQSGAYTTASGIAVPSVNFGNTTYDWSQMTNTYNASSSSAAKNAVATLMYHCGASVKMDYDLGGSSSYTNSIPTAMITYFGYDAGAQICEKSYYTLADWELRVTTELEAGRPVLYRGANNANEGHIFICDGKDNRGTYHFNWGWDGYLDGYFRIDDFFDMDNVGLTPYYTFNNEIYMIAGIQPNQGNGAEGAMILKEGTGLSSSKTAVNQEEMFTVTAQFQNSGFVDFAGEYHIVLLNGSGNVVTSLSSRTSGTLPGGFWWSAFTFNCSVPASVANGNYTIRAAVRKNASSPYILADATSGQVQELPLRVGNPGSVDVTGVTLNKSSVTLNVNATEQLSATVQPTNATNKNVSWSSSNASVATVSSSGLVTAKAAGTATITVTTADGSQKATCAVTVNTPVIPVTGVTLDKSSVTLNVDQTQQLSATVQPTNATNKNVSWSSSNASVATVSSGGLVTAKVAGTATITVTTADGSKKATCVVTVNTPVIPVTEVTLDKTSVTLNVDQTQQLSATVQPTNATNKNVTWSSSNTSVATVSSSGLITAKAAGTTTVTVTTEDGSKKATCAVTVNTPVIPVTEVTLDKTSVTLNVNATEQLSATVQPTNATNKNVSWSSSNASVATVSSSGLVTAKAAGTATITVTTADGSKKATCAVTVNTPVIPVTEVTLDKTSVTLNVDQTQQLSATVQPTNATNKNVTWSSSNASVATVSSGGLVTAKAAGTAIITVTTEDGSKKATCKVTVNRTVVIEEPDPVGEDGKGSLDFSLEIPADATITGTFEIKLPEGYTLDESATKLIEALAGHFDLVITFKGGNVWQIEIKSKGLRAATAVALTKIMNIAYTVDPATPKGKYNIEISHIELDLSDGTSINNEAITVTTEVVQSGTGIDDLQAAPRIWSANGRAHILLPEATNIQIVNIIGVTVYKEQLPAGTHSVALSKGVYIVKAGSAVRKIRN